ncbi:PREDICTED: retinitis pigmentosa 1-like 1 protein [Aptenodytes forsteri]|uniref:retinitis pigmentosa 1-like 1 protein n=1 Tax=Aptenodytes forsteri TaxID=9233 RepID=UPI0009052766|nr:PREDICTED: retinitis pigmentosa 1-like 1 protein [Aptenodytes forsteri]
MTQVPADYLSTTSSYNYEQPFPSVARTSAVTKIPPAKKITFFKSGDPQFAGVKMAINQRSFKSFNALMDDLSHRVPLPFGVRTITTPRGIHCISELDQLEDGGCYLCSDKKYVKPISITSGGYRPGPPRNGRPSSTLRRAAQEGKLEDYSTLLTQHGPRIPKKITLVKNGESGFRRSIILNRRNARSFKTLLDEISEILQFPVKKLYTVDGKKIDSMQALLHCPSVLVCVGREPFKPVSMENLRKHSVEKLPDLAPRSNSNNVNENNESKKTVNFGLKTKKSVIHPRSSSSNRSMRFSLSSEKSYPNGLAASPDNGAPFSNSCSHPKPGDLVHSLVNDDIEKRVHVNKDGSLSVEMKVRFRLLNDETLQWSTQIKKSNLMNQTPCEESGVEEDSGVDPIQKMNPEASSEADESLYPCDIDSYMSKLEESECDEAHCHSCGKKHQDYDIWKNPMHTSQREEPSVRSTWHTRSSCSSTSSRRRVVHKKKASMRSLHTTSSEEFSEHILQESSSYSETIENRVAYRSIKKCMCRSDLSTGVSSGEDQQEHTRTSTSNSQRPSSLMSHSSCENNLDIQDAPEDHEASKTNSQNEDENCFEVSSVKCLKDDVEEVECNRVGSVMSGSSLQSRQSKKNVCEETSSVGRSMSSSGLQKANQEDNTRCSTPANSVHSKSSNCTTPRAKSEQDDHSDDNAVVSSFSKVKDKCLLTQISQESDDRCSQSNISQSSKSRQIKIRNLRVKMSNSSQASLSETLSVCSMHCPAPPKGKPNSKNIRSTMLKHSSNSTIGTESAVTTGKEQKEIIDSSKATSYGSKSAATEVNDQKNEEIDGSCNRKVEEELEGTGMQEEGSDLTPSALPNTSPEEVVQEWLSKIPSETLLMKYEMEDDAEEECVEATTEVAYCTNAEEISEDEKAEKKNVEEAENETKDEVRKETAEVTAINEEAEECVNQEQISEVVSEAAKADQAECSQSVKSSQNNNRRDLPTSVQTSVQIMKALLSSKHETKFDRSNSLPEVSPTMGRKLSNSANILITCLASLQLLDEASEDPSDKSKPLNKPKYMELLNIFQALCFGCTVEKSGPSSGQEASEQAKTASGFKAQKSVDYDFTPMSSSGVDVSSGFGGSGEETTAGARDCTLTAQKTTEFKSAAQVENVETGTELTEAEEQTKEEKQSSRPSTACSKSKGEEKAQSTREDSLIQEAEENKEDQCSNCENGQDEGRENENEENSKSAENGEQEEAEAVNDELPKENLEEKDDQLITTDDTNVNDIDCGTELKADLEEQLEKESPNDPDPKIDTATSVGTSLVQQNPVDPDPTWVLRLLKKIEKEFMAHYVSAMDEFKARWNLQNNQQIDEMILELKEEVSKRIQNSIEKELRKIKSRAGKKTPRSLDEPLKRKSTLQTEQRRQQLQTMHKQSLFSDKNGNQSRLEDISDLSFNVDEDIAFSAAFEDSISKQTSEEEYCPCDSCARKKMASKPTQNPVVATNAPVMKAFDLQQILRLRKNDNEEACVSEAAQDVKTIPSSSVEEAAENGNPNEENDEGELQPSETEVEGNEEKEPELNEVGSSTLTRDEEGPEISESQNCEMENEEAEENSEAEDEADNEAEEAEEPEDEDIGADDEEETSECRGDADGSGTDNNPEGDAAEGSEEAKQDEAEAVEDGNPKSEDEACSAEEENNGEGGDIYDENDEEPTSDDPDKAHEKHEDKGNNKISEKASKAKCKTNSKRLETLNKAAAFSCYSSMGNFSQQSQKGSEDEGEEECEDDNDSMNNHSNGEVQSGESSKPSQMYPDSEEEEEDKASSCTDPLGDEDQADAEGADPKKVEHTDEVQASKKKEDSDEIDQDDLDF